MVPAAELDQAAADLVAAVLAGAAGRTHAEQQAAERAAQVRRLRDLAGRGE